MKHKFITAKTCSCDGDVGCPICDGGLSVCSVCGLIEGSLTTDCPGYECWEAENEAIYIGEKDFKDGKWIKAISPHSPEYYRIGIN